MFFWEKTLLFILILLPTQLGKHFWPKDSFIFGLKIDYLSPTLYLQDFFILFLILLWARKNATKLFSRKFVILLFFFFLLGALNILFSLRPLIALFFWIRLSEFLFFGFIVSQNAKKVAGLLYKVLPGLIIFEFMLGIFQFFKQSSLGGFFWFLGERSFNILTPGIARGSWLGKVFLRPYGTFSHPNSLSGFILVCLILVFSKKNLRFWDKLSVVCGLILILLTFSRTIWLSSFFLGLAFILFELKEGILKKKFKLNFRYLEVVLSLPLVLYFFIRTEVELSSFLVRKDLAQLALKMIKERPFWGVGANNFVISLSQSAKAWQWLYWLQPVHNIFLLAGAETGFLGLLFFVLFILLTINRLLSGSGYFKSLLISLLAILFSGFFDHYWLTLIQNQILFALVLGLSWGLKNGRIVS